MKLYKISTFVLAILLVGLSICYFQGKNAPVAKIKEGTNIPAKQTEASSETSEPKMEEMKYAATGLILKRYGISLKYPNTCHLQEKIAVPFETEMVTYHYLSKKGYYCPFGHLVFYKTAITTRSFLNDTFKAFVKFSDEGNVGTPSSIEREEEFDVQKQLFQKKSGNDKYAFKKINGNDFLISNNWSVESGEIYRNYITFKGDTRITSQIGWSGIWKDAETEKKEKLLHKYDQEADELMEEIEYFMHMQK